MTGSYGQARLQPRDLPQPACRSATVYVDPEPEDLRDHTDHFGNRVDVLPRGPAAHPADRHRHEPRRRARPDRLPDALRRAALGGGARRRAPTAPARHAECSASSSSTRRSSSGTTPCARYAAPSFAARPADRRGGRSTWSTGSTPTSRYEPGATTVVDDAARGARAPAGVCQDFAHLAVGCLRSLGLAARYVSGYLETDAAAGPAAAGRRRRLARLGLGARPGRRLGRRSTRPTTSSSTTATSTVAWGRDYGDVPPLKGVIFTEAEHVARCGHVDVVPASVTRPVDAWPAGMRSFSLCRACGAPALLRELVCLRCGTALGFVPATRRDVVALDGRDRTYRADGRVQRVVRQPRPRRVQLAGRRRRRGRAVRLLRAHPHPARGRRPRRPRRVRPHRGGQAPAGLPARRPRAAGRRRDDGPGARPRLRPAVQRAASRSSPATPTGVITIDLAEGDDAHREALRVQLGEPYRTMLGHLRHEIGHYYWRCWSTGAGRPSTRSGRCSATSAPTTPRRCSAHYATTRRRGWDGPLRQHLRHRAPVGGLGRDLRALPAHPRHPADGRGVRHARRPARRRQRPRAPLARPSERRRAFDDIVDDLAAADLRAQRGEPAAWARTTSTRSCSRPACSTSCASSTRSSPARRRRHGMIEGVIWSRTLVRRDASKTEGRHGC